MPHLAITGSKNEGVSVECMMEYATLAQIILILVTYLHSTFVKGKTADILLRMILSICP